MDSKQIEIEGMKELLKENELEIGRLRKEIKNLKSERDNFMLKYSKAVEEKVVETNKLCTERNKLEEKNRKLKEDNRFLTKISKEYMEKENIVEVAEFTELYKDDLEKENKKLKEELERYKKQYKHTMGEN